MFDIIGIIYTPGVYGEYDPETDSIPEITPPVALDGWHVNTTPAVMAERPELEPFGIGAPAEA